MPYEFNISLSQVLRNCFFFFNFPLIGKRHNDTRFPTIEVSSYSLEHTINRSDGWLGTIIHFHNIFFSPISESSFGFSSAFILQPYFCLNFAHLFIRKCLTISQYTQHTTRFTKNNKLFGNFKNGCLVHMISSSSPLPFLICQIYQLQCTGKMFFSLNKSIILNYFGYRWIFGLFCLVGCRFSECSHFLTSYIFFFFYFLFVRLNVRWKFELKISSEPISTRDGSRTRSDLWFVYDVAEWLKSFTSHRSSRSNRVCIFHRSK